MADPAQGAGAADAAEGADTEEIVRRMAACFGLDRLPETSRVRFAAVADRVRSGDQA